MLKHNFASLDFTGNITSDGKLIIDTYEHIDFLCPSDKYIIRTPDQNEYEQLFI
jgi:hypothetical protein